MVAFGLIFCIVAIRLLGCTAVKDLGSNPILRGSINQSSQNKEADNPIGSSGVRFDKINRPATSVLPISRSLGTNLQRNTNPTNGNEVNANSSPMHKPPDLKTTPLGLLNTRKEHISERNTFASDGIQNDAGYRFAEKAASQKVPNVQQPLRQTAYAYSGGNSNVAVNNNMAANRPYTRPQRSGGGGGGGGGGDDSAQMQVNPLVKKASTISISALFGLLIWRSLTSYEMANEFMSDSARVLTATPVAGLLLANLVGFVVNILKPINFKNHLKVILAVNIVREWVELLYNVFMLIFSSSKSLTPREVYFGRFFMNCWWSLLCVSFSRSRWVL